MSALHITRIQAFVAAGDRRYIARCYGCAWHGRTTSDRASAEQQAADHEMNQTRAVRL